MEKEKGLKPMTIELQAFALDATVNLTKGKPLAKQREWICGKKRTEKRLPSYLNKGFYIPKFHEMTYESVELLELISETK